jgi:hypothetical protein
MPLTAGAELGPYTIVSPIGAGGMGARGPASERSETSRRRGGGAPRNFYSMTPSPCR